MGGGVQYVEAVRQRMRQAASIFNGVIGILFASFFWLGICPSQFLTYPIKAGYYELPQALYSIGLTAMGQVACHSFKWMIPAFWRLSSCLEFLFDQGT